VDDRVRLRGDDSGNDRVTVERIDDDRLGAQVP
jgi:hypothetical protein